MKTKPNKPQTAPVARLSLRRHKHSPADKVYRGLMITVPQLHLRAKLTGTSPKVDFATAMKLAKLLGWRVQLTESVKREIPESRISAMSPQVVGANR